MKSNVAYFSERAVHPAETGARRERLPYNRSVIQGLSLLLLPAPP